MSKGIPAVGEDMPGCDPAITAAEDIPFDAAVMMGEDGFHSLMDSLLRYRSRDSDRCHIEHASAYINCQELYCAYHAVRLLTCKETMVYKVA